MTQTENETFGRAALDELAARWALHDATVRALLIRTDSDGRVTAEIECVPRQESPVLDARIRLIGVTRIDFSWMQAQGSFYLVTCYKALILESGRVYLSLDPFDESIEAPDERDCDVIEAESITAYLREGSAAV